MIGLRLLDGTLVSVSSGTWQCSDIEVEQTLQDIEETYRELFPYTGYYPSEDWRSANFMVEHLGAIIVKADWIPSDSSVVY